MKSFIDFFYNYQIHYILRIILASFCGLLIGFERKNRAKEAGIRTHCVVACAACLMMIISKYGFEDLNIVGLTARGADPSRIASQVVSGVGFLGAGMIFVHKNTIKGLTTAAGIWATSGIGMAIGSGMYFVGVFSTILILVIQITLHMNTNFFAMPKNKCLKLYNITEENFQKIVDERLRKKGIIINDVIIEKNDDGSLNYIYDIELPVKISEESLISEFECKSYIETVK
ncbi:MAG: MgtC/SapB family protein [Clostridia bacterium]|nr:MgtC/SapB family protein [Clostridia bacterium]